MEIVNRDLGFPSACDCAGSAMYNYESLILVTDSKYPTDSDDARQTAAYIFDMLIGLSSVARETDLMMLAYLLEMAGSEASRIAEGDGSGGTGVKTKAPKSPA